MDKGIFKYLVWFVATLFVVYAFCLNTASAVFSDAIKTSLDADNFGVSLASGAFILGYACMQIPAGYLLDKFNARYVVSSGVFLLAAGNIAIAYSDNLILFSLSNFLQGVGASVSFVAAAVLISQWFSNKTFPIIFGMTQTISCLSAGVIHYYFTVALKTHSWNDIYHILALFGFGLFVLTLFIVKSPAGYTSQNKISLSDSLFQVFTNKQILLCSIAGAASFGVLLAYAGLWYMPVQSFYAVQPLAAVEISGMIFAGLGIGTPLLGWLSNRVKSRTLVLHVAMSLGTMTLLLSLYLPHFNTNSLILAKTIAFLTGFFLSGPMLFYTIVSEISPSATRGVAISDLNSTVYLFNTFMLFIPYLFITLTSTQFFTYLWILPFFILLSILLLYFIKDSYTSNDKGGIDHE
jgi:MFS family permease